jgi:putative glutamine amidotransferase
MGNSRPVIGIPMRIEYATDRFYLGRDYCEAVEAQGADPVLLPLIPGGDYLGSVVKSLDGLLMPGSDSDVDPMLYDREPHPMLGTVQPLKDSTDLKLLRFAEELKMPVFGICFGMQSLNVSRGGTLIQDIGSQISSPIKHEQGSPRDRRSHQVSLLEGSLVERLAQGTTVAVNSHHHQAVEGIGRELVPTAWTSDGVVEAIEDPRTDRWVIGVQWHPELGWKGDELSMRLFKAFVESSIQYRRARREFGHGIDSSAVAV